MKVVINKGRRWCSLLTRLKFFPWFRLGVKELKLTITIDQSMFALTGIRSCDWDSNKVFGICDGVDPHKNSFRISYVVQNDTIQFLYYFYENGLRKMEFLHRDYKVGETAVIGCKLPRKVSGRTLPPYYGGTCKAPQKIQYNAKMEYL